MNRLNYLTLSIAALLFSMLSIAAPVKGLPAEGLSFEKSTHNFGKIKQNQPVTVEFTFVNSSAKTVIIEDATAECGCTKPEFPPRPIQPGKSGSIKVTYDSKTMGVFTKKITVKLVNDDNPVVLTISGEVVA